MNPVSASPNKGWQALLLNWSKDLQLWLYITVTLQLFRLVLIFVFIERSSSRLTAGKFLAVVATGLRFDISTAGVFVLLTFLLSLTCTVFPTGGMVRRLRLLLARIYTVFAILVFGVDLVFFRVFNDQFNQMVFGIVYDDTTAILLTIWKEFHPLIFLGVVFPVVLGNLWLVGRWLAFTPVLVPRLGQWGGTLVRRYGIAFGSFLFMGAVAHGGTLWGEPPLIKHAFVVDDNFLNRSVVNPFTALRYTFKDKWALENGAALASFWPSEKIGEALAYELKQRGNSPDSTDLDLALTRVAGGHKGEKPRHIFMLLMESQSGWSVLPVYRNSGLSPELAALADRGVYFPNFIPAGSGTIGSMNTIITGLTDIDLNINYERSALTPYPSGLAANLKRLGYRTRFFYGGFLGWQRLDTFAKNQGFDEVYGCGNMSDGAHTNEWGVDDQHLYDFILKTVDDDTPSFNFVLNTSNHPPYDLDLQALGYPVKALPVTLKATKAETMVVLGHHWYADQQVGRFVKEGEKRFTSPLFAITGDHTERLQISFPGDSVVEQTAVPLILYGPKVLPESGGGRTTAGSHQDIPATLIELAAEPGFRYPAFGENLLAKPSPSYGFGLNYIIGENFIANDGAPQAVYGLASAPRPEPKPDLGAVRTRFNALKALSWYRVKKGSALL